MYFLKHQVWGLATFVSQHTNYYYYYYFYNSDDFPSGENLNSYTALSEIMLTSPVFV